MSKKKAAECEDWARGVAVRIEKDFADCLPLPGGKWREKAIKAWSDPRWGEQHFKLALASLQRAKAEKR